MVEYSTRRLENESRRDEMSPVRGGRRGVAAREYDPLGKGNLPVGSKTTSYMAKGASIFKT